MKGVEAQRRGVNRHILKYLSKKNTSAEAILIQRGLEFGCSPKEKELHNKEHN